MPSPPALQAGVSPRQLLGVGLTSATLLMTELALTRIFSVVMYYHFAFLAISIALFGVSASGVFAFVARRRLARWSTDAILATESLIYALAALPFFAGGLVVTLAVSRLSAHVNAVYAADLLGAAAGCLLVIPLLD